MSPEQLAPVVGLSAKQVSRAYAVIDAKRKFRTTSACLPSSSNPSSDGGLSGSTAARRGQPSSIAPYKDVSTRLAVKPARRL